MTVMLHYVDSDIMITSKGANIHVSYNGEGGEASGYCLCLALAYAVPLACFVWPFQQAVSMPHPSYNPDQ
jgi:hypothetical protein